MRKAGRILYLGDLIKEYKLTERVFYTKLGTGYEFIYVIKSIDKYGNITGHLKKKHGGDYYPVGDSDVPRLYKNINLSDIGKKLFFERHDSGDSDYYRLFYSYVRKIIGEENEVENHIQSAGLEKYEPGRAVSEEYINDRIKEYGNKIFQQTQENEFRRTNNNGAYFARLDVDTQLSLTDKRDHTNHYYLRLYISKNPKGEIKKIPMYEGTWQMYAGLTSENTYFDMYPNTHLMERGCNYIITFLDSGPVIDWRAPITELYYKPSMKKIEFNYAKHFLEKVIHDAQYKHISKNLFGRDNIQYDHVALLKRRFEGNNSFTDIFTYEDRDIKFSNVDPFLLKMLKERRAQSELQDIILTIQENQYDIIKAGLNENHIVQGCAGSGKTMILLHRLSYLLFNNNLENDSIVILGPNDLFTQHISPLINRLELTNVKRYTRDDYYELLIRRYEDNKDYQEYSTLSYNKEIVYSNNYTETFCEEYNAIKEKILLKVCDEFYSYVVNLYESEDISTEHLGGWRNRILKLLRKIAGEAALAEKTAQSYFDKTIDAETYYLCAKQIIRNALSEWRAHIEQWLKDEFEYNIIATIEKAKKYNANSFYFNFTKAVNEFADAIDSLKSGKYDLRLQEEDGEEKAKACFVDLGKKAANLSEVLNDTSFEYRSYRRAITMIFNDEFLKWRDIEPDKSESAEASRRGVTGIFNRIVGGQREKENSLDYKKIANGCHALVQELRREYIEIQNAGNVNFDKIRELESVRIVDNYVKELKSFISWNKKLEEADEYLMCMNTYEKTENDSKKVFRTRDFNDKLQWVKNFENLSNILLKKSALKELKSINEKSKLLQETQRQHRSICAECKGKLVKEVINNPGLSNEIIAKAEELQEYVGDATVVNICRSICKKTGICADGVPSLEIIHLLMVALYYGSFEDKIERLFIDEGQEVSELEYAVLKKVFGKVYFNIYGDVNQKTSANGISDWARIKTLLGSDVWALEENYRNTNQITEYCNSKFTHKMKPIGYDGVEVKHITLKDVSYLLADIQKRPSSAIIAKDISLARHVVNCESNYITVHDIEPGKISLLDIGEAKGLEFDSVLVITDEMNENEKYIAYTRALNELCVLNN